MYKNTWTVVKVEGKISERFDVKVGVHQGSILIPFFVWNCIG